MKIATSHLSYCTNIHPAETWLETQTMLQRHVITVRNQLRTAGLLGMNEAFGIGLRLSAIAAAELLTGANLQHFKHWLAETNCYVFTINGFPYGSFHGTRVKEQVFRPDWSDPARLAYTLDLFKILAAIAPTGSQASVSTLPGSHKSFKANESLILKQLAELADELEKLALATGHDFHLGLEPEPLGHFENTAETLAFFERLQRSSATPEVLKRRIGVNYDACHFALEYDDAQPSLDALVNAGIRISKIHLSSALALDPNDPAALSAIRQFNEPVYFHQALLKNHDGTITRFSDLPDFFAAEASGELDLTSSTEMRVHFHIPLDAEPAAPLRSTRDHAREVLAWRNKNPTICQHFEIETYTWQVLPTDLQRPVEQQIVGEYRWVIAACAAQ